ncbi:AAA family ATPase [Halorubrum lipolyticum]|uniref:Kinase n=1 Tax=Halorubrum lipolyticum DSM 21995 TaxID=1227482 RepID=M0NKT8_9EURY|nr:AAA family ATPase [Halorubrum lipolyticum]EMA57300.1 kinase [Halorubrum lipolyticum DSM 21995]
MTNRDATDSGRSRAALADPASEASGASTEAATATEPSAGALVVVCGLPGVGKTTVAERVADRVDGEILRTDVIRKELFDEPAYTDAETEAVYAELIDRARDRVADGSAVVLDATFADARFRADAREAGERVADGFALVEVECDESVVERRIERRDGISDADFEVHLHFKELFDRIETDHVVVDNSDDQAATYAQVDAAFGGAAPDGD